MSNWTDDDRNGPDDDQPDDGDTHWLSTLIDALDRLDSGSTSGHHRTDRSIVDYDISIGTVFSGDETDSRELPNESVSSEPIPSDRSAGDDRQRTSGAQTASDAHHLTTREADDELQVTADVSGIDAEEITVGFDDSQLVVAVSGREIDRVLVPWESRSADATIKNGILTVRVTPDHSGEADDE